MYSIKLSKILLKNKNTRALKQIIHVFFMNQYYLTGVFHTFLSHICIFRKMRMERNNKLSKEKIHLYENQKNNRKLQLYFTVWSTAS